MGFLAGNGHQSFESGCWIAGSLSLNLWRNRLAKLVPVMVFAETRERNLVSRILVLRVFCSDLPQLMRERHLHEASSSISAGCELSSSGASQNQKARFLHQKSFPRVEIAELAGIVSNFIFLVIPAIYLSDFLFSDTIRAL